MKKKKLIKKKPLKKTVKKTPKKTTLKAIKKKKNTSSNKTKKIENKKKTKKVVRKKKLNIKKTTNKKINKKDEKLQKTIKSKVSFDDKLKEIFEKLINKNKVDGIYTLKLIEKAIPKKFRLPENLKKLENLLISSEIKIYTEDEAKELLNLAKEDSNKTDDSNDEEEKKQTGKTDDPVRLYLRDMGAVELLSRKVK